MVPAALAWLVCAQASAQVNPLPPERAFRFTARALSAQSVEARFTIAEGYYLYRDKIHFAIEPSTVRLAVPPLPTGKIKVDEFFGRMETYRGNLVVSLQLLDSIPGQHLVVRAESQGCADIGICYPPNVQSIALVVPRASAPVAPQGEPARKGWFDDESKRTLSIWPKQAGS
jgi:thioredoxin:protein disulfide reductase